MSKSRTKSIVGKTEQETYRSEEPDSKGRLHPVVSFLSQTELLISRTPKPTLMLLKGLEAVGPLLLLECQLSPALSV